MCFINRYVQRLEVRQLLPPVDTPPPTEAEPKPISEGDPDPDLTLPDEDHVLGFFDLILSPTEYNFYLRLIQFVNRNMLILERY
jgi:hypothetical protein